MPRSYEKIIEYYSDRKKCLAKQHDEDFNKLEQEEEEELKALQLWCEANGGHQDNGDMFYGFCKRCGTGFI